MATLRLTGPTPHDVGGTLRFHGLHAVPGVETWDGVTFGRTLTIAGRPVPVALSDDGPGAVAVQLPEGADTDAVTAVVRAMLDLDTDPAPVDAALRRDPALRPLVAARPGLRSPGAADGFELGVRTIVGQQVSLAGARTVLGRIAAAHGEVVAGGVRFPTPAALADLDPAVLPLPRARGRAVVGFARAVLDGRVDLAGDPDIAVAALLALPGIGPWTAQYLRMRVFGDPDVLLATDLAVRRVAAEIGIDVAAAARWAPFRSYATHHLWAVVLARM